MVKKYNIMIFILLFLCLFLLTKGDEVVWIKYNYETNYVEKIIQNANKRQTYGIEFPEESKQIPYYIKVEVTSNDNNPAPLLCFSSEDQDCYQREQLVKNPNDKTTLLWLKREQFEKEEQKLYINIECENDGCNYTLKFKGEQTASFGPNFVYSYLVGNFNKEMSFEVYTEEKGVYMTVALDGSSNANINIVNVHNEGIIYKSGSIITFFLKEYDDINTSNLTVINIKGAETGEYITLSVHLVNNTIEFEGLAQEGLMLPNGPEITGYLEKDMINEECFPIDLSEEKYKIMNKLYITGRIHTKYAWFFLEDENREYLEESFLEILDGQLAFAMNNNGKMNYVCFELPGEITFQQKKMAFTFSITEPNSLPSLYKYYPPQLTGEIYRRMIPKGAIVFYSGTKNDNTAKKYDYSIYQRKGLTKMYINNCKFYPDCQFTEDVLGNLIEPKPVNQMTIWTTEDDKSSSISNEKYVMVVFCADDDNDNSEYCEFETSIFSKGQNLTLIEDEKFSKYLISGEKGKIIADLQTGRQVQRITFDIMIFSGDITFNVLDKYSNTNLNDEEIKITYDKYFLSNKVFIHINLAQLTIDKVIIDYTAEINSFFTIQYDVNSYNAEQLRENIPSGENYLVQIDPTSTTKTKTIYLSNRFYKNRNPFLTNFYKLNCEFEVIRGENKINFFDGYAQEILQSNSDEYDSPYYEYIIKITESDLSNYNHKMCMLYVSGYEAETNYTRDIIIGENTNQQIIFNNNFKTIRFLYPHAEASKDLALHVNVIDKAFYKLVVTANNEFIQEYIITITQTFYIRGSILSLKCEDNTLCPIEVEVLYNKEIIETEPKIEITIREIKNTPTYIQKGKEKIDFVCGNKFYYLYTDIGKNEIGEITLNFLREFGNIWAKVVRKDQTYIDVNANWRGVYRMPSSEWGDSLSFNKYTKKLLVTPDDTEDCIEGCYLLISIQISKIGEYIDDNKFYPFSILTRITPSNRAYTDIPKVVLHVDESIIGNIDIGQDEKIYEFFEIWLPHDSDIVEFDWQSSVAGLYINLGGIRPTIKNADFKKLPPGKDSILNLTKIEILDKVKSKKIIIPYEDSLQGINLVIGIWTDKTDSINTELYSLRVHQPELPNEDEIDIVLVNTDQKILCNPKEISTNVYRCLFMVKYDDIDANMNTPLLAYSESINHDAINYLYGKFIDRNIFDEYSKSELYSNIPTYETAELNSRKDGVEYIYISKLEKGKYMYINVMTDKPDTIMILTSMPAYNYISFDYFEFYSNPNTEQLLFTQGKSLRLAFPGTDSIMVNIVTLNGHAELSWKNDPQTVFILKGRGDHIILSSGKNNDELIIRNLLINNNNKVSMMEDPGFAFYISYYLISSDREIIFDEIIYGKSLEMSYKDINLPIVLYSKIGPEYHDINIAITFKDNSIDQGGEYKTSPLSIFSLLVKENTIYAAKKDKELAPNKDKAIIGNYDMALKTAQVFLNEDTIKDFNIKKEDNPTLYIRLEKEKNKEYKLDKFSIEAQVCGVNDGAIPVEKVYHYGRVRNTIWEETYYRLKTDKNRPYMRIQIAFNSDNLEFVVSDNENNRRTNLTNFLYTEKARGKIYITFKIADNQELYYLFIYKKATTISELYLNNYAFKYINAKHESDFSDFPILESPEINIIESKEEDQDIITCTFNKLDIPKSKANITYFFKVVENKTHYYGEECDTIAVTESPYYTVYERNPQDIDGKIKLIAKGDLSNWVYLNVIAQVQQNNNLEYISYNGKKFVRPSPDDKKKEEEKSDNNNSNISLFIIIGCILILIIIVLIVVILIFRKRNKHLLAQVKHVSFKKNINNSDPNLLLEK